MLKTTFNLEIPYIDRQPPRLMLALMRPLLFVYIRYLCVKGDVVMEKLLKERFIYFIQSGEDGPIKIGITDNVTNRLCSLQSASPYKLKVLYSAKLREDLANLEERHMHFIFKGIHLRGEWFRPMPFLMQRIDEMKKNGYYSIPEYNWDLQKAVVHNGVWDKIDDFWNGIASVARKYKMSGDIESYRYIKLEVQDLLESI